MIKNTVLNAELNRALAQARHADAVVILDAGMPVPNGCPVIDLALTRGVPSFLQVVHAVLGDFVAERYEVFDLMPQYNPEMYATLQTLLHRQPGSLATEAEFLQRMPQAKAVIRTAEFGSCCNMILYSASGMDKYVDKFNIPAKELAD